MGILLLEKVHLTQEGWQRWEEAFNEVKESVHHKDITILKAKKETQLKRETDKSLFQVRDSILFSLIDRSTWYQVSMDSEDLNYTIKQRLWKSIKYPTQQQ